MAEPYPHFLPDLVRELDGCANRGPLVPSSLRRFFLLMLRAHWSDASNFGPDLEDSLGCLTWSPDESERQLEIELAGSILPGTRSHLLWVSLNNFRFRRLAFGHRSDDFEPDNATERYVIAGSCQLLLSHEAPSADQAFDMAWTTLCFLLGFHESILDALGGEGASFTPELLGEPQLKEPSPKTRIRVDVGCRLDINLAVATTLESHRLKLASLDPTTLSATSS